VNNITLGYEIWPGGGEGGEGERRGVKCMSGLVASLGSTDDTAELCATAVVERSRSYIVDLRPYMCLQSLHVDDCIQTTDSSN
jgi:hypothetical protein